MAVGQHSCYHAWYRRVVLEHICSHALVDHGIRTGFVPRRSPAIQRMMGRAALVLRWVLPAPHVAF